MRRHGWLLILLALIGAGCATTIRAQVLDAETRRPIPGAVVLGVWSRVVGFGLTHHELVGVAETATDADGRFELERLGRSGFRREEAITVYKFGYVAWSNLYHFPIRLREDQTIPRDILLGRFPPTESHQRHMGFIDSATAGAYSHEMIPRFSNAIRQELTLP